MLRLTTAVLLWASAAQQVAPHDGEGESPPAAPRAATTGPATSARAPSPKVLFDDGFESGDLSATSPDGFAWGRTNRTSVVTMDDKGPLVVWNNKAVKVRPPDPRNWRAHSGKYALRFRYPAGQTMAEQRFKLGQAYPEIWFRFWLRVPENFQHGPKNPSNNKFFALWMDGYSQHGDGATAVWNFWRQADGNSRFTFSNSRDTAGRGHHGSARDFLVSPRDRGRWMQIVLYAKMSSAPGVADGEQGIWRRWEGQKEFTLISKAVGRGLQPSKDKTKAQGWAAGYILGWSNATYAQTTEWLLDEFTVSEHSLLDPTLPEGRRPSTTEAMSGQRSDAAAGSNATQASQPETPDYVYCEDFETGREQHGALRPFSLTWTHGVREGAGYRSKYGYSNVIVENHALPPYPEVRFPREDGVIFVHYMLKAPANFYLGRANHGYYLFDSTQRKQWGSAVLDHATDHPAWLDPEWDPHTINVTRTAGYSRITRSYEGFEPKKRGEWHSHQVMIVPSKKDPAVGRMKVWIDGELANFSKHATPPAYDTFWISNYWHSLAYVPMSMSSIFEAFTAPPHPAFEIHLDDLIISRRFIEFGPNRPQVERVRFSDLKPDSFTVSFDTTTEAKGLRARWGEGPPDATDWAARATRIEAEASSPGYFHALKVTGLPPGKRLTLMVDAEDARGRPLKSHTVELTTAADRPPTLHIGESGVVDAAGERGAWKGEVYQNLDFSGPPVYVRAFNSLSYIAWPGPDADDLVDTSKDLCVRYTKRAAVKAGTYVVRLYATDDVRILVDGIEVRKDVGRRQATARSDFRVPLTEGVHTIVVEHTVKRRNDGKRESTKPFAFRIEPDDDAPPTCLAQAIYNSRFHKPDQPVYCGRWSEEVHATIEFGETDTYGRSVQHRGRVSRYPRIKLGQLQVGRTYHWRVTAVDTMGNKTVTPDATFTCGDTIPPAKIQCGLKRENDTRLVLRFRAPGEDGGHGRAVAYDVRWSAQPITVANWDDANKLEDLPRPQTARKREAIALDGLPAGTRYYVAVKAIDRAGQAGLLSNCVSDPPGPKIMDCDGDGYGVGSLKGPDPDDYDASVPTAR